MRMPLSLVPLERIAEASAVRTRQLTLEEYDDVFGCADDASAQWQAMARSGDGESGAGYDRDLEPRELTDDAHPIHLHLVRFQILDGRPFDRTEYLLHKRIRYTGEAFPLDANEAGWKDTVGATPGAVTRIIVKFEGYAGRYVWHCHILEHEDNEMMRLYDVIAAGRD